jgi:Flp pilus assembly protein TadD
MAVLACPAATGAAESGYIGASTCASCHREAFDAWRGSHHDLAMQVATAETVVGDFNDAEITTHGITSRFMTRNGAFFVHTDGPDGEMGDFEVAYTFGVEPLQQYLVPFPDGRIQALSLAWDNRPKAEGGQRWFHLYPDSRIDHEDEFHWTGRQQNWNFMCADCHSTNFVKGYDIEADRYASSWSEIDVGCEACHGPGQAHVEWAARDPSLRDSDLNRGLSVLLRDRDGVTWRMNADTGIAQRKQPLQRNTEVGVCADCHSRRGTLTGGGHGDPEFLDHYSPAFLTESLYFPDGQIEDEVYDWGSFLQSRMYAAGVSCSDCHEPHSLELRASGDAVCTQCHLPAKFAVMAHHGHSDSDATPACADCHMPERTYMVIDRRRDHSIRVPRPDLSARFGVPNACNQCHADKTVAWAVEAFGDLFPASGAPYQDWTVAFHQARSGLPQAEVSLLRVAGDPDVPDIARATAILELAPSSLGPRSRQALEDALRHDSPLVRLAALRTLEALHPEHRFGYAKHLLTDPRLAVRSEAGRVLAATPVEAVADAERTGLEAAVRDYIATQTYNADRPESWLNLGNLRSGTGDIEQAERDYLHALKLAPDFAPAYLNLADLYRHQGRESDAAQVLERGVARQPGDAALHHALGLSKVRSGESAAAMDRFQRAVELSPETPRYAYVYGVALNSAGRAAEAVEVLEAAHERHPSDTELMQALAVLERERGHFARARHWAGKILEVHPADPTATHLLQSLPPEPD